MDGGGSAFNQCLGSSWSVFDLLREVKSNCSLLLSQQLSLVRGPQRFFSFRCISIATMYM